MCKDRRALGIHLEPDPPLHQRSHPGNHIQPSLVCKDCDLRRGGEGGGEKERGREGGGRKGEREKKPVVLFMAGDIID